MFRRECSKETEGEIDFLPLLLLLLLLFVSTFLRFGGTSRAVYESRRFGMKRHRSGEKKTVEKKKNLFLLLPVYGGHNLTVNEKKREKRREDIFFVSQIEIFCVIFGRQHLRDDI